MIAIYHDITECPMKFFVLTTFKQLSSPFHPKNCSYLVIYELSLHEWLAIQNPDPHIYTIYLLEKINALFISLNLFLNQPRV